MEEAGARVLSRPDDLFAVLMKGGCIRLVPRWEINREASTYQLQMAEMSEARDAIFARLVAGLPIEVQASAGTQAEFVRWCARRGMPIPIAFGNHCLVRQDGDA
jgi:hypothetical protein